ncbi:AGE family epimerase/isomerase [Pseudoruegeria sp. HB172150]|uniref:AGE family epimerase/isomerase n=1 Tax=Pseudoruegeria sp. HB172150 TaxID=2721164 RepID=UPI0015525C68|nr:AGE family epimerase/isomerase [Pseudoruegeria sp. HB172150]
MTAPLRHRDRAEDWLTRHALPLWTGAGLIPSAGVWETLDHDAQPLRDRSRRLRVSSRQAYAFACASIAGHGDYLPQAEALFRYVMTKFDPDTGNFTATLNPDGSILTAPHDLYDLAFAHLAAAALTGAGIGTGDALAQLDAALDRLKAPLGWYEDAARRLPRRQNPHMHLFEAMTELYAVAGRPRDLANAQECLALFRDHFLQPDGTILEFFNDDWTPVAEGQGVEPGHMAEWIWLLDRYERVTGQPAGIDTAPLLAAALAERDDAGLLPDTSVPPCDTRRLWPQTELLRACLVHHRKGGTDAPHPDTVFQALWDQYLDTPVPGGWYDRRGCDGTLLSDDMPASSFYHLWGAMRAYLDHAEASETP